MNKHERYIQRALQIAKNRLGTTFPNPIVGAVIVYNDCIIGEGYTSPYGGNHAEVNAINAVKDKAKLSSATIYVTLEPCSHYGKTPPCADLIVKHQIPQVVIGTLDPHDKVAGKGVKKLKDAGCNVLVGILENECKKHHQRFLTFQQKKRPYIVLKWAATKDGFIAPEKEKRKENPEPFWITNTLSKQRVHQWRSQEQAILIGTNTALEDNPKLDVRHWKGISPIRIVLDKDLKIPKEYHIYDTSVQTIIITDIKNTKENFPNISYEGIDFTTDIATQICSVLHKRNIVSVFIEGGSKTLQTFIDANLWDKARVFTGQSTFTKGLKAPRLLGKLASTEFLKKDILNTYIND